MSPVHRPRAAALLVHALLLLSLVVLACDRTPAPTPTPTVVTTATELPAAAVEPTSAPAEVAATVVTASAPPPAASTWLRAYGHERELVGTSIVSLAGGGFMAAACVVPDPQRPLAGPDLMLLGLDTAGELLWTRAYTAACELAEGGQPRYVAEELGLPLYFRTQLAPTADGGAGLATGATLVRVDAAGEVLWAYRYLPQVDSAQGLVLASLAAMPDGGFVLCGSLLDRLVVQGSHEDTIVLIRVDSEGALMWAQEYRALLGTRHASVQLSADGSLLLACRAWDGVSRRRAALARIKAENGKHTWAQTVVASPLPGRPHSADPEATDPLPHRFQALAEGINGEIMLCQTYRLCHGDGVLISRFGPAGEYRGSKRVHSLAHDGATTMRAIAFRGTRFFLAGTGTEFQWPSGIMNDNVVAMNVWGDGQPAWIRSLGRKRHSVAQFEHSTDAANAMVLAEDGSLIILGTTNSFSYPDPWYDHQQPSHFDLLLARMDSEGNVQDMGEFLSAVDAGDPDRVDVSEPPVAVAQLDPQAREIADVEVERCTLEVGEGDLIERRIDPPIQLEAGFRTLKSDLSIYVPPEQDLDGDGLRQSWENAAIAAAEPYIVLDDDERWLDYRDEQPVVIFARATPYTSTLGTHYVLLYYAMGWPYDFGGDLVVTSYRPHRGDTERLVQAWRVLDDHTLRFDWLFTSSHYGPTEHSGVWHAVRRTCNRGNIASFPNGDLCDSQALCAQLQYAADYRLIVQASEDKHAFYPSPGVCNDVTLVELAGGGIYGENCGLDDYNDGEFRYDRRYKGRGRWLFPIYNAGEPDCDHRLIDDLEKPETWLGITEAQRKALTGLYPEEAVWSGNINSRGECTNGVVTKVGGRFCGGLPNQDPWEPECSTILGAKLGDQDPPIPAELSRVLDSSYYLTLRTYEVERAGTDATIGLVFEGGRLRTGHYYVHASGHPGYDDPIMLASCESGDTDYVQLLRYRMDRPGGVALEALPDVEQLTLTHDNLGENPGWYPLEVRLRRESDGKEWTFRPPAGRWLEAGADGTLEALDLTPLEAGRAYALYQIAVVTGDKPQAGTDANVYLRLYGKQSADSGDILLDNPGPDDFERDSLDTFEVWAPNVAELDYVQLHHDNSGDNPRWYCQAIVITNESAGWSWTFPVNAWIEQTSSKSPLLNLELPEG